MSSDLPDFRHRSSLAMAKVLVQIWSDPQAIRSRILEDFDHAPAHRTIERMRANHLKSRERAPEARQSAVQAYSASEAAQRLDEPNQRFLMALRSERMMSARANSEFTNLLWRRVA
jgi:hypothetical protein